MEHCLTNGFIVVINSDSVLGINQLCSVAVIYSARTGDLAVFVDMLINKI